MDCPVPVPLLAIIIKVPTPNIVVDPRVVVLVVEPVVTVERRREVVIADSELRVMVEAYEIYDPVGVAPSETPVKTEIPLVEPELPELELKS